MLNISNKEIIPKVIHYCWFGGAQLPQMAIDCINSWKKYCPDYVIKRWDESNFDINCCQYIKEAYKEKKWAFVSDYARFWILYNEGGLYFDTDVELINYIDDLIQKGPFMGFESILIENIDKKVKVAPGLGLAAYPHMEIYKEVLDFYNTKSFYNMDGAIDQTTVVEYTSSLLEKHGLKDVSTLQFIDEIYIYPPDFFCPMNYTTGEITLTLNTRSIHHYSASWKNESEKKQHEILKKLATFLGETRGYKIWRLYTLPSRIRKKIRDNGIIATVELAINRIKGTGNE